ncbi:MAG: hypothetical protein GC149_09600 [Gammaproteobacteria bacterium]|nr:hypothetical protein [Gammaproteobacteria bacterium]
MRFIRPLILLISIFGFAVVMSGCTRTYSTEVSSAQKISETQGDFKQTLTDGVQFGAALAKLSDLNGDGVPELAVGSPLDNEAGTERGACWILFLNSTGTVSSSIKLTQGLNGFTGTLHDGDHFGSAVSSLNDVNGDGVQDMVVGAPGDDDNGTDRGALWVLLLNSDGTVLSQTKISDLTGGFTLGLKDNDHFGGAVANIGDLNGDGVADIVVGADGDDDGSTDRGAVYILYLNFDGSVQSARKISSTTGNFKGELHTGDLFGSAVAGIGDVDGDGIPDIAVGANGDDDGGVDRGAVWILFMNRDGTVKASQKISQLSGQLDALLADGDQFGSALADVGDLNSDGIDELAVGANHNADGGPQRGAMHVLFLKKTGEVISSSQISQTQGNFPDTLTDGEQFGDAIAGLGDIDGDGNLDIAVGANLDDDGGPDKGAAWVLFMSPVKIGYRVDPNADLTAYFRRN